MALLTRNDLLKKEDLKIERVEMGGGDYTFVRQMTGRERDRFEQSLLVEKKEKSGAITFERSLEDFRAKLAVQTVCDEQGTNVFESNDYETLSQNMSAARLELIVNAAQRLNRISEADKENLIKNSEGAQSAVSTSDSVES